MSSTLEELWFGNIIPFEQFLNGNSHFKELIPIMSKSRDELSDELTHVQNKSLEKYDDIINEMHSIEEVEAFKYGFKLAFTLLIELIT